MFGVIYGIENMLNHEIYIGQTHRTLVYGEENFIKVILEECENQEQLEDGEIKWIARLNCMTTNGYNLIAGGAHGRNFKVSDSTRVKISSIHKGRKRHKSTCQKIALVLKGNKNGVGKKLSDAHKGKPAWNKCKKTPPEIRAKLSASKKGKPSPKKRYNNTT